MNLKCFNLGVVMFNSSYPRSSVKSACPLSRGRCNRVTRPATSARGVGYKQRVQEITKRVRLELLAVPDGTSPNRCDRPE